MTDTIAKSALAWLLTYAVHSTLLIGLAWMASRRLKLSIITRDRMWKVALAGGLITTVAQTQLGVRPSGSFALTKPATSNATSFNTTARTHEANTDPFNTPEDETPVGIGDRKQSVQAPSVSSRMSPESVIVLAWSALAFTLAIVYFGRRLILVGRLANRHAITSGPLPAMIDELCRAVGHPVSIRLTSANTISSPVALGLREICLPEAVLTQLGPDEQRSLLAHELAHLVRRDPVWLYAVSLIERVFFFQPLNRLARKELQANSEYLCDDWAAARTGSGLPLAHCLARVAEWIEASPLGVPVAGMAEQRSLLVTRVARLIEGTRSASPRSQWAFTGVAVALLGAVIAAVPGVQSRALPVPPLSTTPQQSATPNEQSAEPKLNHPASATVQEDPIVVAALIERLKDTDAGVRRAAASSLGKLKSRRAVGALIETLGDRKAEVRSAAAEALANIEDPAALPALAKLLNDESPDVREHVLDAMGNFSEALSVAQVLPALKDARPSLRAKAAEVLGEIGDRVAGTSLVHLLGDPVPDVRYHALQALGHLKDPASASAIMPLLHDDNGDVREAALEALRDLKVTISESDISAALKDSNTPVRGQAIEYLKEHPSASMVATLRKLLDDPDSNIREEAVDALAEARDPAARVALREALKSADPKVRRRAAEALGDRP